VHAESLLPKAERMLGDPTVPRHTRERLVHALGQAGTPAARDLLVAHLGDGDPDVVEAAARALAAVGHRELPEGAELRRALTAQAARVNRCHQVLALLDGRTGAELLSSALRDEVAAAGRRTEVLVSLVHEPRAIASGIAGLSTAQERDRNAAMEMLEVTLGRSTARILLAIVSPTAEDRPNLVPEHSAAEPMSLDEWMRQLVLDDADFWREPWLRACALYALPHLLAADAQSLAGRFTDHDDPVVAETARWVAARSAGRPSAH